MKTGMFMGSNESLVSDYAAPNTRLDLADQGRSAHSLNSQP